MSINNDINSEEGPPTIIKSLSERIVAVRQSSVKETTQFVLSYETCVELRKTRYDETSKFV